MQSGSGSSSRALSQQVRWASAEPGQTASSNVKAADPLEAVPAKTTTWSKSSIALLRRVVSGSARSSLGERIGRSKYGSGGGRRGSRLPGVGGRGVAVGVGSCVDGGGVGVLSGVASQARATRIVSRAAVVVRRTESMGRV
jgi:hypothetical protein